MARIWMIGRHRRQREVSLFFLREFAFTTLVFDRRFP